MVQGGRPTLGPDEDAFTMAATALERLARAFPRSSAPRLHLVGAFPAVAEWGFAAVLGTPVVPTRHGSDLVGLAAALDAATSGSEGGIHYVVVSEIPEGGPQRSEDVPGPSGFALRLGPGEALDRADRALLLSGPAASSGAKSAPLPGLVGDGAPRTARGSPDAWARLREFDPRVVSEGAYVPRARYLENLPSRWRLESERCGRCGTLTFPMRGRCRGCGSRDRLTPHLLPLDGGTVVAATTIGKGGQPTEFDPQVAALGDYGVVLVEWEAGVRLTLQVGDAAPGELPIASKISTRLRRLYPMEGEWRYGRKAVPYEPSPASPT